MPENRYRYYAISAALSLLAIAYCALVYGAGQYQGLALGGKFLQGLPNFYFFYALILPFVGTIVVYLASTHRYARLSGEISAELDESARLKIYRFRKILLLVSVLFSVLITIEDAAEKNSALAPINFSLTSAVAETAAAHCYACAQGWEQCQAAARVCTSEADYLQHLQDAGFGGDSASGFNSFAIWLQQSSLVYKVEVLLNFIAAFIVCLCFTEIFLLVMVKDRVKQATKDLVIWMLVLITFWFPTKIYAAWYSNIGDFAPPIIFWLGVLLLIVGVLLIFFLRSEKQDLYKYGSIITGLVSAAIGALSYLKPELLHKVVDILSAAALSYILVVAFLLILSLYIITDYFIASYEEEG